MTLDTRINFYNADQNNAADIKVSEDSAKFYPVSMSFVLYYRGSPDHMAYGYPSLVFQHGATFGADIKGEVNYQNRILKIEAGNPAIGWPYFKIAGKDNKWWNHNFSANEEWYPLIDGVKYKIKRLEDTAKGSQYPGDMTKTAKIFDFTILGLQ